MAALALVLSLIAVIFAILAYRKSGGAIAELKPRLEDLGQMTDSLKAKIADMLENAEKKLRPGDKPGDCGPGPGDVPPQGTSCG